MNLAKQVFNYFSIKKCVVLTFCMVFFFLLLPQPSFSEEERSKTEDKGLKQTLNLPFAFYNESFGAAVGYVYSVFGYPQKQSTVLASAMVGTNGTGLGFVMGRDIQMPKIERLFMDPIISVGYFSDFDAFINGNPAFVGKRSGTNDSDQDNFVEGDGWDNFFRLKFKYLLPIGHGRDQVITSYKVKHGLLESGASGGTSWNPLASGRTFFEVRPFYRSQQIEGDNIDRDQKTNGFDFSVFWDNRDFLPSPSRGNSLNLKVSRDFDWLDSSDSWTNLQGEFDVYVPLKFSDSFRQQVLAFDFWTSYSSTWEEQSNGTITNRPPAYTGSRLGGLWKMRAYPTQRFSDKAAIYYSAELRLIPKWNPFDRWPNLQKHVGIQWLQFVPFVEVGRVSPSWNLDELHSDLKWDAGIGIRALAKGIVIRIDTAVSEEDFNVQMMISQPFQF
ncbi:MAG: BamA/TamA family outer membrane protein [Deltaproteobacteria bacterium]|nr:BamA/TamA family outer membrane protein [Deltaproteobacteria bacterium]